MPRLETMLSEQGKLYILLSREEQSQSRNVAPGLFSILLPAADRLDRSGSGKKPALLGKIAEEKTSGHGDKTNEPQLGRRHGRKLPQPSLHGFG